MRATKRRSKKSACGLCKPHKQAWAPKDSAKYQQAEKNHARDTEEGVLDWMYGHPRGLAAEMECDWDGVEDYA